MEYPGNNAYKHGFRLRAERTVPSLCYTLAQRLDTGFHDNFIKHWPLAQVRARAKFLFNSVELKGPFYVVKVYDEAPLPPGGLQGEVRRIITAQQGLYGLSFQLNRSTCPF